MYARSKNNQCFRDSGAEELWQRIQAKSLCPRRFLKLTFSAPISRIFGVE